MLAHTLRNGKVTQIQVDVSPSGKPLLPLNSTVEDMPETLPGHYVTLVDSQWVQIPIAVPTYSFSYLQDLKLSAVKKYAAWYQTRPVTFDGQQFQADEASKNLLTQALLVANIGGGVPPFWKTLDNQKYPLPDITKLSDLVVAVSQDFSRKFYEMDALKASISACTTEAELDAIVVPSVPLN